MNASLSKLNISLVASYATVIVAAIGWFVFGDVSTISAIGITVVLLVAPIFLMKTEYGLYALLIIRPLVDLFASYGIISYHAISLNLNAVMAVLVLVWFVLVVIREHVQLHTVSGLGWLVALLAWGGFSALTSLDLFNTVTELLRFSSIVVIFIIASHVAHERPHALTRLTPVIAAAMAIPVLVAFWQLLTASGLSWGGLDNRVFGTFGHPNVLAFYLVCTVNLLIVAQLGRRAHEKSLLYPWLIAGGLIALLFTYTRGAYLGFVVVQLIIGLTYYRRVTIITLTSLVGLIIGWQVINTITINTFNYNLNDIAILERLTTRDEEADSIDWRLQVFTTMAPKTLQSPLLGYGFGNFVTLRQQGDIGFFDDPEAHDDYLRLAIEVGFVGLGLYLLFWLTLLVKLWHNYRQHQAKSWQKRYSLFGIALLVALLGMSVGDNLLQGTAVMWTYLAVLATILTETKTINS